MSRVHDIESAEVRQFDVNTDAEKLSDVVLPAMGKFKNQLDEMCKVMVDLKEKLEGAKESEVLDQETWWDRLKENHFHEMFVGKEVTAEDVDGVVNTLTLMNALVLTIPYGIMSSANHEFWDWVEETLARCPTTDYTYEQAFYQFSNAYNSVIYSTIAVLLSAMAYYLLRPKADKKFRKWWKWARYVIIIMLMGTVCSCVSLVACSTWLFSWYMISTSKYCTYSNWGSGAAIGGVVVIVFTFLTSVFLML